MSGIVEIRGGPLVCVRLLNIGDDGRRSLEHEFGASEIHCGNSGTQAIVEVEFTPISPPTDARYVGRNACYDGGSCYVREGNCWARLQLAPITAGDSSCRIEAESNFDLIRLLGYYVEPAMRLCALNSGHAFLHSSAVVIDGVAAVFSAWGNTGKTNLMLQMANRGAEILTDDWSILLATGKVARYPRPINLLKYNFDAFAEWTTRIPWTKKLALRLHRALDRAQSLCDRQGPVGLRFTGGATRVLETLSNTHLPLPSLSDLEAAKDGFPIGALIDLQSVAVGNEPDLREESTSDFLRRATCCFLYENSDFIKIIAQADFALSSFTEASYCALAIRYQDSLRGVLEKITPEGRVSLVNIPKRAERSVLENKLSPMVCSVVRRTSK